jgi:uncharacterized membrane protein
LTGTIVRERRGVSEVPIEANGSSARTVSVGVRDVRTLAVDDREAFRDVLRDLIAAAPGFLLVGEASSDEEATRAVDLLSPRLVLMDVTMPGIGGIGAARDPSFRPLKAVSALESRTRTREWCVPACAQDPTRDTWFYLGSCGPRSRKRRRPQPANPSVREARSMAIGPVQLIVIGFNHPEFHGEIIAELERLHDEETVRVIDALAVHKDADGEIEVQHLSNLTKEEAIEVGSTIGALIGLGIEGERGAEVGAVAGAEAMAEGGHLLPDEEPWDVLEEIPNDSAAALILLEHHWAVPLRDAVVRAGGFRIGDGFISPLDLVDVGLHSAEEAAELHAMENAGQIN